ncbi:MAG: DUF2749 domain-containing protein [Clostridia bacterium]|nr:DUF2749 domain-containing protein [Clostridia bacterium]
MKPIDVIILIIAVAVVGGVIAWRIIRKKQGKSGCCDCSSCSGGCASCPSRKTEKTEE